MSFSPRILIKWASRERPEVFARQLPLWDNGRVDFLIALDENDPALQRYLDMMPSGRVRVIVDQSPAGKVRAMNLGVADFDWDILILAQDDSRPYGPACDATICGLFEKHGLDCCLFSPDGYRKDDMNTQVIVGRKYFDRFGYIYHPDYIATWCDNEFTDVSRANGREVRVKQPLILHDWIGHNGKGDDLLRRNESHFHVDKATYLRRKAAGFP